MAVYVRNLARLALRALELAGRAPWLAFFNFRCVLAIVSTSKCLKSYSDELSASFLEFSKGLPKSKGLGLFDVKTGYSHS